LRYLEVRSIHFGKEHEVIEDYKMQASCSSAKVAKFLDGSGPVGFSQLEEEAKYLTYLLCSGHPEYAATAGS